MDFYKIKETCRWIGLTFFILCFSFASCAKSKHRADGSVDSSNGDNSMDGSSLSEDAGSEDESTDTGIQEVSDCPDGYVSDGEGGCLEIDECIRNQNECDSGTEEAFYTIQNYIKASDTHRLDFFGFSVSIHGDTLAVGATSHSVGESAVYIFIREGMEWDQQALIKVRNPNAGGQFDLNVALHGDTLAVGATGESSDATGVNGDQENSDSPESGAVYVFIRENTQWTQQAYLKASNADAHDNFGSSVSLYGDTLAVASRWESSNAVGVDSNQENNDASRSGAVYIFNRDGTTWSQEAYLKASNAEEWDYFGGSLSLYEDTLAIGAHSESSDATGVNGEESNNGAPASGAVYIFVRDSKDWIQQAYLKASNTDTGDSFGGRISLYGDTLAVGVLHESSDATGVDGDQDNNDAPKSGAVYVFVRNETEWTQQAYLKASNTDEDDLFGSSVSLYGSTLAIGAEYESSDAMGIDGDQNNNDAPKSGAVFVFVRNETEWTQQAYLKASNTDSVDLFGLSISLYDDTLVGGAPNESSDATGVNGDQDNNDAPGSGAVYVYN